MLNELGGHPEYPCIPTPFQRENNSELQIPVCQRNIQILRLRKTQPDHESSQTVSCIQAFQKRMRRSVKDT